MQLRQLWLAVTTELEWAGSLPHLQKQDEAYRGAGNLEPGERLNGGAR